MLKYLRLRIKNYFYAQEKSKEEDNGDQAAKIEETKT